MCGIIRNGLSIKHANFWNGKGYQPGIIITQMTEKITFSDCAKVNTNQSASI